MGINHKVVDQKFDEDSVIETDPVMCSKLIVEGKNKSARALLSTMDKSFPVLTADTLVFTPSRKIVGKPENYEHSRELLREFSGATHSVFSTVMISTTEQSLLKTCETKVLPRTHGSALFTRGETQALATTTLGAREDEKMIDSLE